MTTAVKAGETLHFQLKSLEIGAGYGATIDPVVTYTSDTYDAGQDLGLARIDLPGADRMQNNYPVNTYQNPVGNWSYQYAATGTNNYINFDAFYDTTPAWGDLPWSFIKDGDITELPGGGIESSWQHPIISNRRAWLINAFDAVYTYTAPRDGTITVTNTITVFGDPNWVNPPGVELTVYKKTGGQYVAVGPGQTGSEIYALKGSDHESYTPEAMTTAIKAGETLHFQLKNANRGPWHNAAIDPRIVYLTGIYNENDDLGITTLSPRIDRPAGSDLDTSAYPVTAGGEFVYSGEIEADEILDGVINGTLPSGAYTVKNNRTLVMDLSDITIDFSGLKFIVEPDGESHGEEGEKRFALYLAENQNLFIKNLTLEVKGTPAAVIAGDGFNNVTFTGIEIIDSNNLPGGAEINLLSVQGGAGQSDFVFDALRFESKDNKINKMAIGVQASTAVIKNSYIDGVFIDDNSYAGARIENNILKNTGDVLNLNSNSTAIYNTIESADGAGVTSSGKINILAALNIIESSSGGVSVRLENVTNGVLLLNRLKQISAQNSTNITVAENTFAGGGVNFENVNYALGTGNAGMTAVTGSNNANLSGSDFVTGTLPAAGVNEDLLPKLNKELFVPMERKTTVGAGILLDVSEYISLNYKTSKYVIIPPGAYSSLPVTLYDRKDYTIYAYGVLCEFENTSATPLLMYDCENIAVKGLYIDYATPPNGQATVVSVSGGAGGRIHFKMDDGYYQDLLDREKFSYKTIELAGTLWFEEGSDIVKNMIEKVPVSEPGEGMFSIPNSSDTPGIKAGDKLAFRGVGTNVTHFEGCSGIMLEDCTVYGGSGFAFSEFLGNNPTILNRFAVVPGPAPKLPGGGRGPERLLSTCDSTHSTDMRYGPQITNCVFESATDDGTNINAQFGGVTGFDAATRTIIYGRGQTAYNGICAAFKEGDRVLIYTVNGELLCDTVATGNTVALGGGVYSVTVEASDITLKEGVTINIQNASASGNNFLIENTRQYGNWTRGFLIKAIGGRISNCTIDSVGCAAIYICPEVTDGYWPECGFSEDIIIEKNLIKNTGYMYSGGLYSTPINITGQVANTKDPNYMMIQRITVRNNVIENRRTMYALHINGAQNIKIENNDWGFMYGRNSNTDTQTGVLISTAMDIELNGNIYPPLAVPKILTDAASTVNIFGTDIGTPASEFVIGGIKSVYNGNGWDIVLELENISNTAQNGTVNIVYITPGIIEDAGSKTYNLTAGETAELVYPVAGLPVNLKSALFSVTYTVDGEDEIIGYLSENLYFNAAVKTNKIPVFGEEPDKIWNNAAPAAAAAKETDPDIYNTSVRFLWDDEYLYMLAEITDPYHHQPSAGEYIWNDGDSIQFAIEPGRSSGTAGQLEIGFALTNTGEISQWCWESSISEHIGDLTGKGFNTVINRDDENKKTVYQIAMPWLFIGLNGSPPQNGDIIAFNLCVNNKDNASDVRTFYEFYGGIANNKNPSEFGLITVLDQVNEIDYKNVIEEALGELLPEVSLNITISGGMVRGIPSRVAVGVIGILPEVREIRGAADFIGTGTVIEFLDGAEITVIIYGDLTGSGYVGMDSVVALARHIAAIKRLDEVFLEAADTNGDNRVNIADLIRLARHHAGVDTSPLG
ncbi:MAG: hypothetical protein FWH24_04685 [Oscillospiraceae bacterium]|nr:hypothetical protein [Oscillospiraceae bacterium]